MQNNDSETAKLKNGTIVQVKTKICIDGRYYYGDCIAGEVIDDVYSADNSVILINKGTLVRFSYSISKNGVLGKAGMIIINGGTTMAVDGTLVHLSFLPYVVVGKSRKWLAYSLGIILGLSTFYGWLFLLLRGKNAKIPSETEIPNVSVSGNYSILSE